jgi:phospholipid/cholesterol/gamma-HCH transport system permease protein
VLGLLASIGRGTARWLARLGALARFAFEALGSLAALPPGGRRMTARIFLNQLRFTALDAVGLIVLLSGILSFLVISSSIRQLGDVGATDLIGRLMVVIIARELGPILTALALVGRSGTAISAELATNTVLGEVRALEAIGIDPQHYLVLPRLFGCIVSAVILTVVFDVVAFLSGFLAVSNQGMSGGRYLGMVLGSLTTEDIALTVAKGLVFGVIVGVLPCFQGLSVRQGPTEIPQAVIRGTVGSIVLIFICAALFVLVGQA